MRSLAFHERLAGVARGVKSTRVTVAAPYPKPRTCTTTGSDCGSSVLPPSPGGSGSVAQRLDLVQRQLRSLSEALADIAQQHSRELMGSSISATFSPEHRPTNYEEMGSSVRRMSVTEALASPKAILAESVALAQHAVLHRTASEWHDQQADVQYHSEDMRMRSVVSSAGARMTFMTKGSRCDFAADSEGAGECISRAATVTMSPMVTQMTSSRSRRTGRLTELPRPFINDARSLLVRIVGASGLSEAGMSADGFADLYCCCEIPGKPQSKFKTGVSFGTLQPVWNDTVEVSGFEEGDELEFTVWDCDPWDKDHFLGKAVVTSAQLGMDDEKGDGSLGFDGDLRLLGSPGAEDTAWLLVKVDALDKDQAPKSEALDSGTEIWPVWRPLGRQQAVKDREASVSTYVRTMMTGLRKLRKPAMDGDSVSRTFTSLRPQRCRICRCPRWCNYPSRFMRMHLMVLPGSWKNLVWQFPGGMLIMYDVVMIPMQFFEVRQSYGMYVVAWISCIYWTLDVLHTFCTCYEEMGAVVSSPRRVAINYAKFWLLPDVLIVSIDWALLLHQMEGFGSRSWRSAKILRSLRVIRSAKAYNTAVHFMDRVQSQSIVIVMKMVVLVMGLLLNAHYVCCYWYGIGDKTMPGLYALDLPTTWVDDLGVPREEVMRLYLYSIQWTLAQSGVTSWSPIEPTNWVELLFSQFMTVLWIVLAAGTYSCFTLWALQMRDTKLEYERQETRMRKYLLENKIGKSIGNAVVRFVRVNYDQLQFRVSEASIPLFKDLPVAIRLELHRQIYLPMFQTHPVFAQLQAETLDAVVHLACHDLNYLAGQQVFDRGDNARSVFFLKSGELAYCSTVDTEPMPLKPELWIAEIALWRRWKHVGTLASRTSSSAASVDVDCFNAIMAQTQRFGIALINIRQYAQMAAAHFSGGTASDLWTERGIIEVLSSCDLAAEFMAPMSTRTSGAQNQFMNISPSQKNWLGMGQHRVAVSLATLIPSARRRHRTTLKEFGAPDHS